MLLRGLNDGIFILESLSNLKEEGRHKGYRLNHRLHVKSKFNHVVFLHYVVFAFATHFA